MDDDAEPKNDALEKLINNDLAQKERTVGLACLKVDINGNIEKIHRGFYNFKMLRPEPLSDEMYSRKYCQIQYSSFVGLLIKANAVKYIGLPDKDFFIKFDDVEYCIRLSNIGDIYLITSSVIVHKDNLINSNQRNIVNFWKNYYGIRNNILLNLKHNNKTYTIVYTIIYSFYILMRMIFGILYYNDDYKKIRIKYLLKAFIDGIINKKGKLVDPVAFKKEISGEMSR